MSQNQDIFARIGAQRATEQKGFIEPPPPKLPKKYLPAGKSNPRAAFRPLPKLDTANQLQAELAQRRNQYAPFLRNLAPAVVTSRIAVPVTELPPLRKRDSVPKSNFLLSVQFEPQQPSMVVGKRPDEKCQIKE